MDLDYLQQLMGGTLDAQPQQEHRDILVVGETRGATLAQITCQCLGRARELADLLGVRVATVLIGNGVAALANEAIACGSDALYIADSPDLAVYDAQTVCALLADLIGQRKPEIVLFGATARGRDCAPRLAARLETGLLSECVALDVDESERLLLGTRATWDNLMLSTVACPTARPQIATVRPGCLRAAAPDRSRTGTVEQIAAPAVSAAATSEPVARQRLHAPLAEARVIVCGGRGIGGAEGFALLDELATLLDGEVAATRSAVEFGYAPRSQMIDIAGTAVRPALCIAVGASGAFPFRAALRGTRCLVAVNTDRQAPIMARADYAIAGDYRTVVPELIRAIRETQRQ